MKWIMSSMVAIALFAILVQSCKKDEPVALTLSSLTAGGVDLNGASSATGVPTDAAITASFSTAVDASTANTTNITLTRDYDNVSVDLTITTSGSTVTITPNDDLASGALYALSINNLKSTEGEVLSSAINRTYTTVGTFAPSGAVAYWNFEDGSVNDLTGAYAATENTDVTFAASKSTVLGQAAYFNGKTTYIEYPGGPTLMNTDNFTLSFWVRAESAGHVDASGNPKGNFVLGTGFFKGFQFEIPGDYAWCKMAAQYDCGTLTEGDDIFFPGDGLTKDNGGWQGCIFNKDLTGSGGVAALLKDTWANVVVMYDAAGKVGSMYINGELMKAQDFDLWPVPSNKLNCVGLKFDPLATDVGQGFVFGFAEDKSSALFSGEPWGNVNSPDSNHFQGWLDDVRVYHRVLTQDEITLMYNSSK
ncbi:MAG: Ig-like domain-containing protein [Chitinophagaceae bacterium]|nr:Ig-like domain-containing protein [Chitinophagaceae bacterium]